MAGGCECEGVCVCARTREGTDVCARVCGVCGIGLVSVLHWIDVTLGLTRRDFLRLLGYGLCIRKPWVTVWFGVGVF